MLTQLDFIFYKLKECYWIFQFMKRGEEDSRCSDWNWAKELVTQHPHTFPEAQAKEGRRGSEWQSTLGLSAPAGTFNLYPCNFIMLPFICTCAARQCLCSLTKDRRLGRVRCLLCMLIFRFKKKMILSQLTGNSPFRKHIFLYRNAQPCFDQIRELTPLTLQNSWLRIWPPGKLRFDTSAGRANSWVTTFIFGETMNWREGADTFQSFCLWQNHWPPL